MKIHGEVDWPDERKWRIKQGLVSIVEGILMVISLGQFYPGWVSRIATKKIISKVVWRKSQ